MAWAQDIIVVDSFSTDETLAILAGFKNVRVYQRTFDNHANQWNYALQETAIQTEWVLALDSDYILTDECINEIKKIDPLQDYSGYRISFRYCVFGKPLRGSLYPAVTVLFRTISANYIQDGHTQRVQIEGKIGSMDAFILHDDRKPLSRWLKEQKKYMTLEANIIFNTPVNKLNWPDKARKLLIIAPPLTFFYCVFIKKGFLDGWAGFYYAMQRTITEMILSIELIKLLVKKN